MKSLWILYILFSAGGEPVHTPAAIDAYPSLEDCRQAGHDTIEALRPDMVSIMDYMAADKATLFCREGKFNDA